MEAVAGRLLTGLTELGKAASQVRASSADASFALGAGLSTALANIKQARARISDDLKDLSARGDHVASSVGKGVSRLDFTRELGDIFDECAVALAQAAGDAEAVDGHVEPGHTTVELAEKIFRTYNWHRESEKPSEVRQIA